MKFLQISLLFSCLLQVITAQAQVVSRSYEMRYFGDSTSAQGTIGFNGDSTLFTPQERIQYLDQYADFTKFFFQDGDLDQQAVFPADVDKIVSRFKEIPLPEQRQRIELKDWRWKVYDRGRQKTEQAQLAKWSQDPNVILENGQLRTINDFSYPLDLNNGENWRFALQWETNIPKSEERSAFLLLDNLGNPVVLMGITSEGECFYKSKIGLPIGVAQFDTDTLINFKLLVDVEAGRFSLFINDEVKADFVRTLTENPVETFFLKLPVGSTLDNLYGMSYERPNINPFEGEFPTPKGRTFLEDRFELSEELGDLGLINFRDEEWEQIKLPVQSGDRFRNMDLILRKPLLINNFQKAKLHFEQIAPNTEIWLNNKIVYVHRQGQTLTLDISRDLLPNQPNKLMIRMRGGDGWQLQKVFLDLTGSRYIESANLYATQGADASQLHLNARLLIEQPTEENDGFWQGKVRVKMTPWHPRASTRTVFNQSFDVQLRAFQAMDFSEVVNLPRLSAWSPNSPNLYQVEFELLDGEGNLQDDYTFVTGIRKLEQRDGSLYLNNQVTPLFGANLTDYLPFEVDNYSEPRFEMDEWIGRALASLEVMNGNALRVGNLNNLDLDRLLDYCDQLGILVILEMDKLQQSSPWSADWERLKKRIEEVRHHPSVILWQAPRGLMFNGFTAEALPWMERFYEVVNQNDANVLIALTNADTKYIDGRLPSQDGTSLYNPSMRDYQPIDSSLAMVWRDSLVVRGNADRALSFGKDWDDLRNFPIDYTVDSLRYKYLSSDDQIYINYDSESLAGQENPFTVRGVPYRYSETYASPYPSLAIGSELPYEAWKISQAWQAMSTYETLRKKRWLNYDGIFSAKLWNGGDPTTILDAKGYKKLNFYATQMAFQEVLAGSQTTDFAYSIGEEVPIFINYSGNRARFQVTLRVKNLEGKTVKTKTFPTVSFRKGSATQSLGDWVNNLTREGWYIVEYEVAKR
ncbi:MAG: hypothetical protein AAGI23_05885 [Bacteroidota bacterium]